MTDNEQEHFSTRKMLKKMIEVEIKIEQLNEFFDKEQQTIYEKINEIKTELNNGGNINEN